MLHFEGGHETYASARPFPHAIIDEFLPHDLAARALENFPEFGAEIWRTSGREYVNEGNGRKFEMASYDAMPVPLRNVVELVHGKECLAFLRELTGYSDLLADSALTGGGLNMSMSGGFLRTHADFNYSNTLHAYRTVNLIWYLNLNWREEFGGYLELWEPDLSACTKSIAPIFNRAVIFTTYSYAYHGFRPVMVPEGHARRSMNFYFYRPTAAPGIAQDPHKTLWQATP